MMLRLFLSLWLALTPTFVWAGSMSLLGVGKRGAAAVTKGYTFLAGVDYQNNSSQTVVNYPVTMTGAAGRLIVFAYTQTAVISAVVYDPGGANATTLFLDGGYAGSFAYYSANIPAGTGSKNIQITYATDIIFLQEGITAWLATGLATGFDAYVQNPNTATITVNSGDFLFAVNAAVGGVPTNVWTGSTAAPTANRLSSFSSPASQISASADWASPTVGSFTVGTGTNSMSVATYK